MIVKDTQAVPALTRGIEILKLLSQAGPAGASVTELQRRTAIPPASCFRILRVLLDAGLLAQDARTGSYLMGSGAMLLGFTARAASPLVNTAQPILRELSAQSHQMAELAVAAGNWTLMILETWLAERSSLKIRARPGMFFPLNHLHAPGLCYLAFDTDFGLQRFRRAAARPEGLATVGLSQPVAATLTGDCERFRRLGYCWRIQAAQGTARITAPIYDADQSGHVTGALSIVCDQSHLTPVRVVQWGSLLKDAAEKITITAMTQDG